MRVYVYICVREFACATVFLCKCVHACERILLSLLTAILLISAVRGGLYVACVCVYVYLCVKKIPGSRDADVISDCNEAFLSFVFVFFFWKTSDGRTNGWTDWPLKKEAHGRI